MKSFALREIHDSAPRLTQTFWAGLTSEGKPPVVGAERAHVFNVVHMSTDNSAYYYQLGKGQMSPEQMQAIMYHYSVAHPSGVTFAALLDEWRAFHFAVATNSEIWRALVAYVTGQVRDQAVDPKKLGKMPAQAIRERYAVEIKRAQITSPHIELFVSLMSEYAIFQLASLGLVIPSTPFVYRVNVIAAHADWEAYEDALRGRDFITSMETMASVDLSHVKKELDTRSAITPSFISTTIANGALTAHDRVRASYDASQIVESVASALWRVLDTTTPDAMVPKERVQTADGFARLLNNATFFAAVQRRVAERGPLVCHFDDETMASVIIPMFVEAINTASPYKERTIDECVSHLGIKAHREYDSTKTHVAIFERWDTSRDATAFVPVRQTRMGWDDARFLMEERSVSDAMTVAMTPVASAFSVSQFVDSFLSAIDMAEPGSFKVQAHGTELLLAMPSVTSYLISAGIIDESIYSAIASKAPVGDLELHLRVSGEATPTGKEPALTDAHLASLRRTLHRAAHSYYVTLFCFALSRGGNTFVTPSEPASAHSTGNLVVVWKMNQASPVPLGLSAILQGNVETIEPLERLAYSEEVEPARSLTSEGLPLSDFDRSLHIWRWSDSSARVVYRDNFNTIVAGRPINIDVDETEILGLGYSRPKLRFHIAPGGRAIVKMWLEWHQSTIATLRTLRANVLDHNAQSAIDGRILATQIALVTRLRSIGTSSVGENVTRTVNRKITQELYGLGLIDAMKQIHATPHRVSLETWAGMVMLRMLDLVSDTEHEAMAKELGSSNAITTVMAMMADSKDL